MKQTHYNFALVGRRIEHSFSPAWFTSLFEKLGLKECHYGLHDVESLHDLHSWVHREGICGFNVTAPFKCEVIPLLDELSPSAKNIGAVNCVVVKNDRLIGHNTDWEGFAQTLPIDRYDLACVLGSGGASMAVVYALKHILKPEQVIVASRMPKQPDSLSYDEAAQRLATAQRPLLINATPVGMGELSNESPWKNPQMITSDWTVYDLIYNPSPTLLLRQSAEQGALTMNGLAMLHRQAQLGWALWASNYGLPY